MKLVLYDETSGIVHDLYEGLEDVVVNGDNVTSKQIQLTSIPCSFIVLDDSVSVAVGDTITDQLRALDKSSAFSYVDMKTLKAENDDLRQQLAQAEQDNLNTMLALTEVYEELLAVRPGGTA